jgi:hypothetical protein
MADLSKLLADLNGIDVGALDAEIERLRSDLSKLEQLREAFWPRKQSKPTVSGTNVEARRLKLLKMLADGGPMFPSEIARWLECTPGQATYTADHHWFENTQRGWALSDDGRAVLNSENDVAG